MSLEINQLNFTRFLDHNNNIVIMPEFFERFHIGENCKIQITNIEDKTIKIIAFDIDKIDLEIEIRDCSFKGIFFTNCKIKELHLLSVDISEYSDNKFKAYDFYIDNCRIQTVWSMYGKFHGGFLIRNNCLINSIRISDAIIENSLAFINSKATNFEVESSQLEYLRIEKNNHPNHDVINEIDKINLFRSIFRSGLRLWDVKFQTLSIYKSNVTQSESLSDYEKVIHIVTPEDYDKIEHLEISESNFERDIIISISNIKQLNIYENSFNNFRINFWTIEKFKFSKNTLNKNFFLGFQDNGKDIKEFLFSNNTFVGEFYISDIFFEKKFYIIGSTFQTYPSFIQDCHFKESCLTNFEFTNFSNLIFQNINFENVSFQNFDILNVKFKNCYWKDQNKLFYNRRTVSDENNDFKDYIQLKKVYADLKMNFEDRNDYLAASKFYISEQEIKRKIAKNNSLYEYLILTIHKSISAYGESLSKVLFILLTSLLSFSIIYLFTGFKNGEENIKYFFQLDIANICVMSKDYITAVILSIKNLVPFPVNTKFFIYTDETFKKSQTIELLQKIFNFILLASFTETFLKNLKK